MVTGEKISLTIRSMNVKIREKTVKLMKPIQFNTVQLVILGPYVNLVIYMDKFGKDRVIQNFLITNVQTVVKSVIMYH
jgi:hypothetical protein